MSVLFGTAFGDPDQGLFVVSVRSSYEGHAPVKVKEWLVTGTHVPAEPSEDVRADSSIAEDERVQPNQDPT